MPEEKVEWRDLWPVAYFLLLVFVLDALYRPLEKMSYWQEALWSIPVLAILISVYRYVVQLRYPREDRIAFWKIAVVSVIISAVVGPALAWLWRVLGKLPFG